MPEYPQRFADLVAAARRDEDVEVFARRANHIMTTAQPDGRTGIERGTHWQIEIRSAAGGCFGSAMTTDPSPASLRSALHTARELRGLAARPVLETGALPDLPLEHSVGEVDLTSGSLDGVHAAVAEATHDVTTTVVSSVASVWVADSRGRLGCYTSSEAQLALRSRPPAAAGALGAALARTPEALDISGAVAELDRELSYLAIPRSTGESIDWMALAPLATAQLVSHLSGGLVRTHYRKNDLPYGAPIGSEQVTLVDDGRLADGPGSAPFDDEGVPTRRTEVIREGRLSALLSGLPLAASTGNARRRDWRARTAVAPSNLFLEPAAAPQCDLAGLAGTGLVVTRLTGVRRAALDLRETPLQLTLHGATLRRGLPQTSVQGVVSATVRQILSGVVAVCGPQRFYRVNGVVGGTQCVIEGVTVSFV